MIAEIDFVVFSYVKQNGQSILDREMLETHYLSLSFELLVDIYVHPIKFKCGASTWFGGTCFQNIGFHLYFNQQKGAYPSQSARELFVIC